MDATTALLELEEAPLNLREVLLRLSFERADSLDHIRDLDLFAVLGVGSFEKAVTDRLFAAAATAGARHQNFDVQDQGIKDAPIHILVLVYARLLVNHLGDIHGHFLAKS